VIRHSCLQDLGLLDERFVFYSEDYDWFKRLKDAGWSVLFCPQAQVVHHWGASSGQRSEWAMSQLYRSKRLYYAKHYGILVEMVLRLGLTARFSAKALLVLAAYPIRRNAARQEMKLQQKLMREMLTEL
jgi:GT2 family glycosyltransferase